MARDDLPIGEMVREDGTYPTVPLRKPNVSIGIVQTHVRGVDGDDPAPKMAENLKYILDCIDRAQQSGPCDLLCFHEFPIQGFKHYNREQSLRVAFEIPCRELDEVGQKAKKYNCYITMGCLMKDPDWPGHVMNTQILIGPSGEVIAKHWKQRARRGTHTTTEQFNTCIYDVFDRFVEMYGWEAVVPVVRTDIGNIALSAVQYEPELFRAFALKGAEIICRSATGGFRWEDMQMTAYHNDVFVTMVNNSLNLYPDRWNFVEAAPRNDWVGRSSIFGPKGVVLAEAGPYETKRRAVIRMQEYRDGHRIPDVQFSMYKHVYDQYRERYDPNLWMDHLPSDKKDAANFLKGKARWQSYWYDF
jgi:predicted amidohydrolase